MQSKGAVEAGGLAQALSLHGHVWDMFMDGCMTVCMDVCCVWIFG